MLNTRASVYNGDSVRVRVKDYEPVAQPVPYGSNVDSVYFDGYPQIVKREGSKPVYKVMVEKDVMVQMRDGVHLAVDIYRPDTQGKEFPAILSFGHHGKELQEVVRWWPKPQAYWDTPLWDGCMEAGDIDYVVTRGYISVVPEPRGRGKSEGMGSPNLEITDIYDTIEWVAAQQWCDGNVGMMGPSVYSRSQYYVAPLAPPHLKALNPAESAGDSRDYFNGIFDCIRFAISSGRHGNDSGPAPFNSIISPRMLNLPDIDARLREAFNHPDIKYNSKWYSLLKYPTRDPANFDALLSSFHPGESFDRKGTSLTIGDLANRIKIPIWMGTPWNTRLYIWVTFEAWENVGTPRDNKKLTVLPPSFPNRPYSQYQDEIVRWYDYWLKGIDNGVMDEPPIKLFVMGVNKWRFENEWPLARTEWTKFYLHPGGLLSTHPVKGMCGPDTFTQPAPYLDPTVYCLTYRTKPLKEDTEVTGPIALYLDASIDLDDTNWMVDLVDIDSEDNKMLVSSGALKAAFRALDKAKSKPYQPIHPRRDPVPVPPNEVIEYAIAMMPTSNVFKRNHRIELIVRNQDDLLSRLGVWGVYYLPFMRTVTHNIHFGHSYLLLPIIPDYRA